MADLVSNKWSTIFFTEVKIEIVMLLLFMILRMMVVMTADGNDDVN